MEDAGGPAKGPGNAGRIARRGQAPGAGTRPVLVPAGTGAEDDIAVLAVRAHPVAGERPPEAGPVRLPPSVL